MVAPEINKPKGRPVKKGATTKKKSAKTKAVKTKAVKTTDNDSSDKEISTGFVLDAVMVINEAKEMHKKLSNLSMSTETVILDASKIEMIDTANLQLLLAFVETMKNKQVDVCWKDPSTEFLERASILNLEDGLCLN